jgi:hypothetical protein
MEHETINDIYIRIRRILKNDQHYPYTVVGQRIVGYLTTLREANRYYDSYPPLLDIAELGAALEYEGTVQPTAIIDQITYKLAELKKILPDIR